MITAKQKRELEIIIDYKKRAKLEKEAGGFVKVNVSIPYIAVNCSNGEEYFFQDEEAQNLIDEATNALGGNLHIDEYLLVVSQGW